MKQPHWLLKSLNIQKEEANPVFLMMIFSFFVGLSLSFYFTASNALFLKHFSPKMIPVSFIASGILVYLAWLLFSRIDRKNGLYRQVMLKYLFVFLSVTAISIGVRLADSQWLTFIMYTWVRVQVYITLVNFWGVAGRLFNIRQGKRIFGLISAGEVISIIIGYFSIPLILKVIKAPDLLFLSSFALLVCLGLVYLIFRNYKEQLEQQKPVAVAPKNEKKSEWNYLNLVKKPYFKMISLMALLPIFGYLFVDFLFLAQTKVEFSNNPETIARFLGIFLGSVAVLELIFKLFSGRFLNKYGLRPSLLSLPIILTFSIIMAALFGSLYGTVGLFFSFVALARLFERSIRGAVYEPAFQLLYQPVPAEQRLPFQNQIEGIPKASGTVLTGVVILVFSVIPAVTLVSYTWLFILILGFWIWISFKMYEEYRNMLKSKLSEMKSGNTDGENPMAVLIRQTVAGISQEIRPRVISFFEKADPLCTGMVLNEKVSSGSDLPFEYLIDYARSDLGSEREQAAILLGSSGRYNTYKLLINLLQDPDPAVRKAAILSSGRIRRVELWPYLIENLRIPAFTFTAVNALKLTGEAVLPELERVFEKTGTARTTRLKIITIAESMGTPAALKFLRNQILHPDHATRFQALLALSHLEYHAAATEISFIRATIENAVETMVWIMASVNDLTEHRGTEGLRQALIQELEDKKEHLFLLLSLIYDARTIGHIRSAIESKDANARIYALEISDMTISDEIKELFFPIFEDLPVSEKLHRFRHRFPQQKISLSERLEVIINCEVSKVSQWTKACALDALRAVPEQGEDFTAPLLAANMVHPDPLLSELAGWILYNRFPDYFNKTLYLFDKKKTPRLSGTLRKISWRENNTDRLLFEKIQLLKSDDFFAPVNETDLMNLILSTGDQPVTLPRTMNSSDKPRPGDIVVSSPEGYTLKIPADSLFEIISGNPVLTERYLNFFLQTNNA